MKGDSLAARFHLVRANGFSHRCLPQRDPDYSTARMFVGYGNGQPLDIQSSHKERAILVLLAKLVQRPVGPAMRFVVGGQIIERERAGAVRQRHRANDRRGAASNQRDPFAQAGRARKRRAVPRQQVR